MSIYSEILAGLLRRETLRINWDDWNPETLMIGAQMQSVRALERIRAVLDDPTLHDGERMQKIHDILSSLNPTERP